ncbi:MAG: FAD-dependent oxidoreductase, partial [Alphaproteobacteria bacterium]
MLGHEARPVLNGVMIDRCDIAIVGGGLNGQTAALALARAGFDVVIVERGDPAAKLSDAFDGRVSS